MRACACVCVCVCVCDCVFTSVIKFLCILLRHVCPRSTMSDLCPVFTMSEMLRTELRRSQEGIKGLIPPKVPKLDLTTDAECAANLVNVNVWL